MRKNERFILERKNKEPIGEGGGRTVYDDPSNNDRVIAFNVYREQSANPIIARGRYYLGKILHILFPDNLADVHLSSSEPDITVRQKLDLNSEYRKLEKFHAKKNLTKDEGEEYRRLFSLRHENETVPKDKYDKLLAQLRGLGIHVDPTLMNFALGEDNKLKYVEIQEPFYYDGSRAYGHDAIKDAIGKLGDPRVREKANNYLQRLEILHEQYETYIRGLSKK